MPNTANRQYIFQRLFAIAGETNIYVARMGVGVPPGGMDRSTPAGSRRVVSLPLATAPKTSLDFWHTLLVLASSRFMRDNAGMKARRLQAEDEEVAVDVAAIFVGPVGRTWAKILRRSAALIEEAKVVPLDLYHAVEPTVNRDRQRIRKQVAIREEVKHAESQWRE